MKREDDIKMKVTSGWAKGPNYIDWNISQGLTGLEKASFKHKQKNPVDPANNMLTKTEALQAMTKEEWDNEDRFSYWKEGRTKCQKCGKKLSYDERFSRYCSECQKVLNEEKRMELAKQAVRQEQQASVCGCQVAAAQPVKSAVQFKTPEEIKDLKNSMCVVSTIQELAEHNPNRPIMFVHIENFNYYAKQPEKNDTIDVTPK